jgi:hypothetical protein
VIPLVADRPVSRRRSASDRQRVGIGRHLDCRRQSPRSEADAEHAKAKAALLRIRIAEKQRELVHQTMSMN